MARVFPTCQFHFDPIDPYIDSISIDGGTSLSGINTSIATDGGGKVVVNMTNARLMNRSEVLLWRAVATGMNGGNIPIVVPLCQARYQPTNGRTSVPHSDQTTFSDETEYAQWDCTVTVAADAVMGDISISLNITSLGKPLIGGEWFSIDHPNHRHRAYNIWSIDAQTDTTATVRFFPPLREDVTADEGVEFAIPKCMMRLVGEMRAPPQPGGYANGNVAFVEDFSGSYE